MKNEMNTNKGKAPSKAIPKEVKFSGDMIFRAKEGIVLPVKYGEGIARITSEKDCTLHWESLPYDSKIMIKRSFKQDHIMIKGAK